MLYNFQRKRRIKPMLAKKGSEEYIRDDDYAGQTKFDGTAIIAIKNGSQIVMRGRSWKNDFAPRFPEIVRELRRVKVKRTALHSELTFYSKRTGKEKFITALAKPETKKGYRSMLEVHDVLYVNRHATKNLPYSKRLFILKSILRSTKGSHVRAVKTFKGTEKKKRLWKRSLTEGREGIMLKRLDAPYEEGIRSDSSVKLKKIYTEGYDTADCAVVGVTRGKGRREKNFGALILAQRDRLGDWRFVGKTSGFSDDEQKRLLKKLRKVKMSESILVGRTPKNIAFWTKPRIVVEVKYHEKQKGHSYRFPAYVRERTDKPVKECMLELQRAKRHLQKECPRAKTRKKPII